MKRIIIYNFFLFPGEEATTVLRLRWPNGRRERALGSSLVALASNATSDAVVWNQEGIQQLRNSGEKRQRQNIGKGKTLFYLHLHFPGYLSGGRRGGKGEEEPSSLRGLPRSALLSVQCRRKKKAGAGGAGGGGEFDCHFGEG